MIPAFCALGFLFLGFRYGMYANEGWPLPYRENLLQMLVWGSSLCLTTFILLSVIFRCVLHNQHNYLAKLFVGVITEVLGVGVVSGSLIIRGLIIDPWFFPSLLLFSGVTALASVLYFGNLQIERRRNTSKTPFSLDKLKLEHTKYLQFVSTVSWIIVFSLLGYLSTIFFNPGPELQTISADIRLRLLDVDVIGLAYFLIGTTFGVLGQLIRRLGKIENMIARLS